MAKLQKNERYYLQKILYNFTKAYEPRISISVVYFLNSRNAFFTRGFWKLPLISMKNTYCHSFNMCGLDVILVKLILYFLNGFRASHRTPALSLSENIIVVLYNVFRTPLLFYYKKLCKIWFSFNFNFT